SGKELLRFREHAVCNRLSVTPRANDLSPLRQGQPLRVHKNTRIVKLLVEALHKLDVALQIFFRPPGVLIPGALFAMHHQNVFHESLSSGTELYALFTIAERGSPTAGLRSACWSVLRRGPARLKCGRQSRRPAPASLRLQSSSQ